MATETATCPHCGGALTAPARFCPNCGNRLEGEGDTRPEELPPPESGRVPVDVVATEPRFFGVTPPLLAFGLGCAGLALAIVFFTAGRWPLGAVLLLLAVLFYALFLGVARRRPTSALARAAALVANGVSARAHFVGGSVGAWSGASRHVVRVRRELRALRLQRERVQFALGAAAYREDEPEIDLLRTRMREIDDAIEATEASARQAIEEARRRVGRERFAMKPTERIAPEDSAEAGAEMRPPD